MPEIYAKSGILENLAGNQNLIAIDTSLGSLVAVNNGNKYWEFGSSDPLAHAEVISELISRALDAADLNSATLTGVVMGVGPGPFTGLRIGMAAATAYALGANLPLLPVVSHEAGALGKAIETGYTGALAVVQDARRKELFITAYEIADAHTIPNPLRESYVVKRAEHQESLPEFWPEAVSGVGLLSAAHLRLQAGGEFGSRDPLYLRDPDVRPPAGVKPVVR
ncbi:tRNA (adenosine(37)-N6)-threonylcarbamoyltransferase complex dimerization subunit type 1 TsaB [Canibacter zhoujuaniae]|uniref:tRNA (adenosine(37)-N6)-threonylcarbamoyltransferase complex dimerization subunit type 1 TsaB n=1 Tax=Canibacter zhoujuaniae TaxID=2708343 RepID=UPI00141EEBB3|nr:tRNA (adenosine(37)-N6)-threonylcarbamoyltransferase complex dimerization subunit type 1 TsaB [Canibacter zhoujuaniae]